MVYSYQGKKPNLSVYDNKTQVNTTGNTIVFNSTENTLTINFAAGGTSNISINEKIRIAGDFTNSNALAASSINGREFTVSNVDAATNSITINTTGLAFPDDGFTLTETDIYVMSDESEQVEAFFEGAQNVYDGATVNFSSQKIVIREKGDATKHSYTNKAISALEPLASNFQISSDPTAAVTAQLMPQLSQLIRALAGLPHRLHLAGQLVQPLASRLMPMAKSKIWRLIQQALDTAPQIQW